jgi:hypothetical protein
MDIHKQFSNHEMCRASTRAIKPNRMGVVKRVPRPGGYCPGVLIIKTYDPTSEGGGFTKCDDIAISTGQFGRVV